MRQSSRFSRRQALRAAGAAGVTGAATVIAPPGHASTKRTSGRDVAIFGGGMAGLTAAHELIERGFGVTVYEPTAFGGKARSMPFTGTGRGGRKDLPGEHGFRFFPGFYRHVPDTMRRIPFTGNDNGVEGNLVTAPHVRMSRTGGPDLTLPTPSELDPKTLPDIEKLRQTLFAILDLGLAIPAHELLYFVDRLVVFLTSSDQRRLGQWDYVSWLDFVRADGKSEDYRTILARGVTSTVVAAKEELASTRTIGTMGEALVLNLLGQGNYASPDRLLNAPTNEAWIDPWVQHLRALGVRFVSQAVEGFEFSGGRINSARTVDSTGRPYVVEADWFLPAVPVERARNLWSPDILRADPQLARMNDLAVDWMVGIQYYLRNPTPIGNGHVAYFDTPWALTSISQAQFWQGRDFSSEYGDGNARECLSVDISDWDTAGILYGKPAKTCTRDEIVRETWAQLKASLNDQGHTVLTDDDLYGHFLDPAIVWSPEQGANRNETPLLVNTVGSWVRRPSARTEVANLLLAGDYVQTNVDLATMEGANESARAAVNALLENADSPAPPCAMYTLHQPAELEPLRAADARRYAAGLPHALDFG